MDERPRFDTLSAVLAAGSALLLLLLVLVVMVLVIALPTLLVAVQL